LLAIPSTPAPQPAAEGKRKRPSREELEACLRRADGNVSAAARELGRSVKQVYRWVERLEIDLEALRKGS